MRHVNAAGVLPPRLLRQLQRHCSGYVYVPALPTYWDEKRARIMRLHAEGLCTAEISRQIHVCVRRVQQVLRETS